MKSTMSAYCYFYCVSFGVLFVSVVCETRTDKYQIPDLKLEAYEPAGFKASLPDHPDNVVFVFHARVNENIAALDPGAFYGEVKHAVAGKWTYHNPDIKLKVGDQVNYWVFVQNSDLGFRRDKLSWTVSELIPVPSCEETSTIVTKWGVSSQLCRNSILLYDNFSSINTNEWLVNHYIPFNDPDYEFVSYENNSQSCYINDNKLYVKPVLRNEIYGTLDLKNGCSRVASEECEISSDGAFILPPIISAKLTSILEFNYGKVEIKAKLPAGDWIYPELYLQSVSQPTRKIWIAYARGNQKYTDSQNNDYGAKLLFGGPVLDTEEPARSKHLISKRSNGDPFSSTSHLYSLLWTPSKVTFSIDGEQYGMVENHYFTDTANLVLGLGVGGINDFPEDFVSNGNRKPWINGDRTQVKDFYKARNVWKSTWDDDLCALQIEYVKVTAL